MRKRSGIIKIFDNIDIHILCKPHRSRSFVDLLLAGEWMRPNTFLNRITV